MKKLFLNLKEILTGPHQHYFISLAGVLIVKDKALIVRIPQGPNKGYWDIPGGRIDNNEDYHKAFQRELKEELNLTDFENLGVVDYDIWNIRDWYPICVIIHLIKTAQEPKIKLSPEHDQYKWIKEDEIDNYQFWWPNSPRFLKKAFKYNKLIEYKN